MRRLAAPPLLLAVVLAVNGWFYLLHPSLPGPRVGEALPLDELSRHSAVSLVWFVAVWGVAGALLGVYTRWARIERVTAALVFAAVVGGLSYVATGFAIAVVRQVSVREGFDAAGNVHAVYLAAAVVGLAVAAVARPRPARRTTSLIASLVAVAGSLDLLSVLLPGPSTGLLPMFTPDRVRPLAHAAAIVSAVALLASVRGLVRRRHRAWQVAVVVAGVSTALHVLHGLNQGSLASAVILTLLIAARHEFSLPGDTGSGRTVLGRLAISAIAIGAYSWLSLWIHQPDADQPIGFHFVLAETLQGLVGLQIGGSPDIAGFFGATFPLSLLLLGIAATLWIVAAWIAPWRHRVRQGDDERSAALALVHAWGTDTLAPFALRADKSYFFSEEGDAFLAYTVVNGVAIVSGDPIGNPERVDPLLDRFFEFARRRDWRIAILGASEARLPAYAVLGLRSLYHGDEAVVDTETFSLEGRAIRKVRQSVHRLDQQGYTATVLRPDEIDDRLRRRLEAIAKEWRGAQPNRGFVMALDTLFRLDGGDALFVIGRDPAGEPCGFLHFAVSTAGSALSLSSMPRLRTTPNGFNEWLICTSIDWARANGFRRVSLNFAPFAALLAPEGRLTRVQEVERRILVALKGRFQFDNLLAFNDKFFPCWEPRYVVYERRRDLPRVGVAALNAEAYMPFQTRE